RGEYAQVQMNQVFIVGPVVTIDQVSNEAWVDGVGIMKLPSKNNLDGTPRAQETELVITWEKAMWFDGQRARFEGKVKATQDPARCAFSRLVKKGRCCPARTPMPGKSAMRRPDRGTWQMTPRTKNSN